MLQANRHLEEIAGLAHAPLTVQTVKDLVALGDRALEQARPKGKRAHAAFMDNGGLRNRIVHAMTALLPRIELESAPNPTAAVIWLHGLGADGNDFAGLVPELDLDDCPPIRFVFPHAPSIPVTLNGGYVMPAWYDILGLNLVDRQDAPGIQKSEQAITALIANEVARGIPHARIVLAGFSQGCAMALHTGLRLPQRIAGIMALSGYLPLADRFASERQQANAHTPVFMAHGTQDPVVVLARGEDSRKALEALGHPVQWHTYPMQHAVHPREIADISAFLKQVLGASAGAQ